MKEQHLQNIRLLFAASVGAAAALRILEDPEIRVEQICLDSTPLLSRSTVEQSIVTAAVLKEMKKHRKKPDSLRQEMQKQYGEALSPVVSENLLKLSEKSLKNLCAAFFCNSSIRNIPEEVQRKMVMSWGTADELYKKSKRNIQKNYPYARMVLHEGEAHCSYLAKHMDACVRELESAMMENL